jgi:hypothetical protein
MCATLQLGLFQAVSFYCHNCMIIVTYTMTKRNKCSVIQSVKSL